MTIENQMPKCENRTNYRWNVTNLHDDIFYWIGWIHWDLTFTLKSVKEKKRIVFNPQMIIKLGVGFLSKEKQQIIKPRNEKSDTVTLIYDTKKNIFVLVVQC